MSKILQAVATIVKWLVILYPIVAPFFKEASKMPVTKNEKFEWVLERLVDSPIAEKIGIDSDAEKDLARAALQVCFWIWRHVDDGTTKLFH